MPLYKLMVEDDRDIFPASLKQLQAAIYRLGEPTGPTFLNLKDEDGNWAQVGGTNSRYRVEVRDIYGEGFQHWVAAKPGSQDRTKTVVYYRNRCTENEHPYRRCPLGATVANVLGLPDAFVILSEYWATGARSAKYIWDDVTQDMLEVAAEEDGMRLKVIKPKGSNRQC
jgi:hypothetical protein